MTLRRLAVIRSRSAPLQVRAPRPGRRPVAVMLPSATAVSMSSGVVAPALVSPTEDERLRAFTSMPSPAGR